MEPQYHDFLRTLFASSEPPESWPKFVAEVIPDEYTLDDFAAQGGLVCYERIAGLYREAPMKRFSSKHGELNSACVGSPSPSLAEVLPDRAVRQDLLRHAANEPKPRGRPAGLALLLEVVSYMIQELKSRMLLSECGISIEENQELLADAIEGLFQKDE